MNGCIQTFKPDRNVQIRSPRRQLLFISLPPFLVAGFVIWIVLPPVLVVGDFRIHVVQYHAPRSAGRRFENAPPLQVAHHGGQLLVQKFVRRTLLDRKHAEGQVALQTSESSTGRKCGQPGINYEGFNGGQVGLQVTRDGFVKKFGIVVVLIRRLAPVSLVLSSVWWTNPTVNGGSNVIVRQK